ncbi:hypothetical protein E1218_27910 [Kribbella turkmenica]|uniref:Uncharacterized protein n=1 Tax=Kribbella turkmenica TaxID=2530375 RepID=A0A4R4WEL0_9ACTN|nr:hypothetical protein [Kribbella turkmenica]TDD17458.1 hypothetical protein E1218_27910 [Kribbella turkmenica]
MDRIRRRAGSLLGLGLVLGLGWTIAVSTSMPSWFDPDEACALRFGGADSSNIEVRTGWFPPSATCEFTDGSVRDFISPTRSAVLSVTGVLILVLLVAGLALTVRRLSGDPGPQRTADGADLTRRRRKHLAFGALDMAVVVAVVSAGNVLAIVLGGPPGGILFAVATITGLSALAVVLDRHVGPLPSSALDSRRRGTAAGLIVFAVIFAATAVTGQMPFFRLWSAPLAAVTYAVVAAVQWSRLPHYGRDHRTSHQSVG